MSGRRWAGGSLFSRTTTCKVVGTRARLLQKAFSIPGVNLFVGPLRLAFLQRGQWGVDHNKPWMRLSVSSQYLSRPMTNAAYRMALTPLPWDCRGVPSIGTSKLFSSNSTGQFPFQAHSLSSSSTLRQNWCDAVGSKPAHLPAWAGFCRCSISTAAASVPRWVS